MTTVTLRKDETEIREALRRVKAEGERVILKADGEPVGALVSIEDLHFLEDLEERIDLEEYRAALKEDEGKPTIPWETLKQELGL
jgi:antitoxin (DNA-binding transcriptional repressor) of toxin-antitoxin stability system